MAFAFNNAFQAFIGESLGICSAGFVKKWAIDTLTFVLMVLPQSDQTLLSDLSNAILTFCVREKISAYRKLSFVMVNPKYVKVLTTSSLVFFTGSVGSCRAHQVER